MKNKIKTSKSLKSMKTRVMMIKSTIWFEYFDKQLII